LEALVAGRDLIVAVLPDDVLDGVLAGMREFFATHAGGCS
jgi:hypothetical protein